jgi:hypothetical protein
MLAVLDASEAMDLKASVLSIYTLNREPSPEFAASVTFRK